MSVRTQLVAEVEFELSDRKFRFFELTRSLLVRHPDRDDFDGCWMSTIGRGPIAPGYSGLIVLEDLTHPVSLAPQDRRQFILSLLYGRVGDSVRSGAVSKRTESLIEELDDSDHQPLRRFAQRAKTLLARPELFDYDDWCRGGLSKHEADWPPAGLPPQPAAKS